MWMKCFARTVETGSFSSVARELGIGQPSVSRYVAMLEDHLGARLLQRSTRKLHVTPEGERYYTEIRTALETLAEADANARGESQPQGLLRVSCAESMGVRMIMPLIRPFLARYPLVEIHLAIDNRAVDLVEDGIDLTIRAGVLKDSSLKARRIGFSERVCVATIDYVEQHSAPQTPPDLLQHQCILYSLSNTGNTWTFNDQEISVAGNFRVNSIEGVYNAVMDGLGIAMLPLWRVQEELERGNLKLILPGYDIPGAPINIMYPERRLLSRRASAFMDFVAEAFAKEPMMHEGAKAKLLNKPHS